MTMGEHFKEYVSVEGILDFISWEALIFLVATFVFLFIGKLVNDWITPYKIDEQLTTKDNKALAVSFIGYMLGLAIIIVGVVSEPSSISEEAVGLGAADRLKNVGLDLLDTLIWSVVGIILLNISRIINDKIILSKFDNIKEIIEDKNVGTGAVQFGSYIGTAFVIKAVVSGEVDNWGIDVISTAVFFILGQLAFVVYGVVYQKITTFDIHKEIEEDNVAAGIGFGMNLAAIGIILSNAIEKSDSLIIFLVWFVEGAALLLITRFLVDKIILPGVKLDDEIMKDRNWGAALIEGGSAVMVAFLLVASFA